MNKFKFIFALFLLPIFIFAQELRVMSWNIENAFDTVDTKKKRDKILERGEYRDKIAQVASVIEKYAPDIVALCEVENIKVLEDLAIRTGHEYFYLIEGNDPRGIDVAVLSNIEMDYRSNKKRKTPYDTNPNYRFSRDCTVATFKTDNGRDFHLLTTHLKSNYRDDGKSEKKRLAQVRGIFEIIDDLYKEKKKTPFVMLCGDLNATRYSSPLQMLEKSGLKILNYLENQKEFYTYIYRKQKQDLDYIIVNDELYDSMKRIKIRTINRNFIKSASDHYPILLDFKL